MDETIRGIFWLLEGIDGAGKTTQAKRLVDTLTGLEEAARYLRAPGGPSTHGDQLRALCLANTFSNRYTQEYLHLADLIETATGSVLPALAAGEQVVMDRFIPSTYVYAIHGLGLSRQIMEPLMDLAMDAIGAGLQPIVPIYLRVDPELARERARVKADQNHLDVRPLDTYKRLAEGYEEYVARQGDWYIVNANRDIDVVADDIAALAMLHLILHLSAHLGDPDFEDTLRYMGAKAMLGQHTQRMAA